MHFEKFVGLIAATHTPYHGDGSLNLNAIEPLARHLDAQGLACAFIGGSTGECHSLTVAERQQLARRWFEVTRGTGLRVIVHVGSNCLEDACALARQAQSLGAAAISALAPCYFKPATVDNLAAWHAAIAHAASDTPFYHYDIPALTRVELFMPDFLAHARSRIPNLAGLKFTNPDLAAFQECQEMNGRQFDLLWGVDEMLLAALAVGARAAVGSTYNFAAPACQRLIAAFQRGDLETARREQLRCVQLVRVLSRHGYLGSAKALMRELGVDVGPARPPLSNPSPDDVREIRATIERMQLLL